MFQCRYNIFDPWVGPGSRLGSPGMGALEGAGFKKRGGFSKTYLWQVVWAHSGLKWSGEVVDCIDWTGLLGEERSSWLPGQ